VEQKLVQGTVDLNTQIEDLKALHEKTLEEKRALLESLDGCEATISSLQEELKKLQKESLAEKEKINYDEDMAQIASQLKEELKDIKSNHDILQKEIESLTTERCKLQELNMTQKETISKLVEELSIDNNNNAAMVSELKELYQQVMDFRSQMAVLSEQKDKHDKKEWEYKSEIKLLKEKTERSEAISCKSRQQNLKFVNSGANCAMSH
jgi:chromosome segregation ATPase